MSSEYNFVFHIYSQNGKPVDHFIGANTVTEKQNAVVLLFESGSEFLVCRRETDANNPNITHVYLREISLGWMKNSVLWLDDTADKNDMVDKYQRHATYWDVLKEN